MTADQQADVLGERMNQLKQSWPRVWISGQNQTLRPVNDAHLHIHSCINII